MENEIKNWRINGQQAKGFGGDSLPYIEIDAGGSVTVHVAGNGRGQSLKDARLICAGPKLLAALKTFVNAFEDVDFSGWTHNGSPLYDMIPWAQMETAIAEAEAGDPQNEAAVLAGTTNPSVKELAVALRGASEWLENLRSIVTTKQMLDSMPNNTLGVKAMRRLVDDMESNLPETQ